MPDEPSPEKIIVQCGACNARFRLGVKFAGKTIKCPKCESPIAVPAMDAEPEPVGVGALEAGGRSASTSSQIIASAVKQYDAGSVHESDAELLRVGDSRDDVADGNGHAPADAGPPRPRSKGGTRRARRPQDDKNDSNGPALAGSTSRRPSRKGERPSTGKTAARKRLNDEDTGRLRREGSGRTRRDREGGTNRRSRQAAHGGQTRRGHGRPAGVNNNMMPLVITGVSVVLVLIIVVVFAMQSGDDNGKQGRTDVAGNPCDSGDNPCATGDGSGASLVERFERDWETAEGVEEQMSHLERWYSRVDEDAALATSWRTCFATALRGAKESVEAATGDSVKARGYANVGAWAERIGQTDAAQELYTEAVVLDGDCVVAREGLGYRQYEKPEGEEIEAMDFESLLTELDQYEQPGRWYSPEEYSEIKVVEERVISEARETMRLWEEEPFFRRAHEAEMTLKNNTYFRDFLFETYVARPFVVLETNDGSSRMDNSFEDRKDEMERLLQAVWREWHKVVDDWELVSQRAEDGDTLEDPFPFVWVSFHSLEAYTAYQDSVERALPPGARAFYDANTRMVMFWQEPEEDTTQTIIHETIHQLMDRFSRTIPGQYRAHWFTEGSAEYFAVYDGEGESFRLGQLAATERARDIGIMRHWFDQGLNVAYGQMQITPDDWVFWDAPMLVCMRDINWVRFFSQRMALNFINSPYRRNRRAMGFAMQGEVGFHSMFYAYAWAFTLYLATEHPDEFREYAMTVMNTERGGEAETFCRCFNIEPARPMPDIARICGPRNERMVSETVRNEATQAVLARINILHDTPGMQQMQRDWVDWMKANFPAQAPPDQSATPGPLPWQQPDRAWRDPSTRHSVPTGNATLPPVGSWRAWLRDPADRPH